MVLLWQCWRYCGDDDGDRGVWWLRRWWLVVVVAARVRVKGWCGYGYAVRLVVLVEAGVRVNGCMAVAVAVAVG